MRKERFFLWAALALVVVPARASRAGNLEKYQAGEVALDFVKAMARGDTARLLELSADPFSFDGREVAGEERRSEWERFCRRNLAARQVFDSAKLETLDYQEMVKRFGKPPQKFRKIPLRDCIFTLVSLAERPGFMLILHRPQKDWLVIAAGD